MTKITISNNLFSFIHGNNHTRAQTNSVELNTCKKRALVQWYNTVLSSTQWFQWAVVLDQDQILNILSQLPDTHRLLFIYLCMYVCMYVFIYLFIYLFWNGWFCRSLALFLIIQAPDLEFSLKLEWGMGIHVQFPVTW